MPRPNFNNALRLPARTDGDGRPGPLARGPIDEGDEITWIQVWIFQNPRAGRAAAATGESPWGARFKKTWKVDTKLVDGSDPFSQGKPAQAMALALIMRGGETKEFYWWSEAIMIAPPRR